jgi:AcrR family transcriptional regulator
MAKLPLTKIDLLHAMAAHVLKNGLNTASLRPLANAAGTSDRMLVYHFRTKDGLIAELLLFLAEDLAGKLEQGLPAQRAQTCRDCVTDIAALLRRKPYNAYMRLWLDIVSAAGQGSRMHARVGHDMITGYLDWLAKRLPTTTKNPAATAGLMMTLIEGMIILDTVGHSTIADSAVDTIFAGDWG